MHVPIPVLIVIGIIVVCVVIYAIGMHFVAKAAAGVFDGLIKAFWR